jgi:hypothetical protein
MSSPKIKSTEVTAMEKIERESSNKRFLEDSDWIQQVIMQAQVRRWTGKLTVNFKGGVIGNFNREETVKPPHVEE